MSIERAAVFPSIDCVDVQEIPRVLTNCDEWIVGHLEKVLAHPMQIRFRCSAIMGSAGERRRAARFFDLNKRLEAISAKGGPLEALNSIVPFESFRADIEAVVRLWAEERKSNASRTPFDAAMMFKILVLQTLYNLSDFVRSAIRSTALM
jgi:hypothetical protein